MIFRSIPESLSFSLNILTTSSSLILIFEMSVYPNVTEEELISLEKLAEQQKGEPQGEDNLKTGNNI